MKNYAVNAGTILSLLHFVVYSLVLLVAVVRCVSVQWRPLEGVVGPCGVPQGPAYVGSIRRFDMLNVILLIWGVLDVYTILLFTKNEHGLP